MTDFFIPVFSFVLTASLSFYFANSSKDANIFKQRDTGGKGQPGKLVGGWAIMFGLFGCFLAYQNLNIGINILVPVVPLFFLAFFLIGFFDDLYGMKALQKLFFQTLVFCWFLSNFDLSLYQIFSLLLLGLITINGFNFLDGINGLLPLICFVLFLQPGQYLATSFIALGVGYSSLKKRNIYLGDSGSLLLGSIAFWIAVTQLGGPESFDPTNHFRFFVLFFFLPFLDVFWAIVRRTFFGPSEQKNFLNLFKKISKPDRRHIHHVFKKEYGELATIIVFMLVTWVTTNFALSFLA